MCGRVFFFSLFFFFTSVQSLFLFGSSSFATTIPFFPIFFSVIILLTCNELAEPLNIFIFVPKKLCFSSVMLTFFTFFFSLLSFFPFPFIFHLSFFTTCLFSFLFSLFPLIYFYFFSLLFLYFCSLSCCCLFFFFF